MNFSPTGIENSSAALAVKPPQVSHWEVIAQISDVYKGPVSSTLEGHGIPYEMLEAPNDLIEYRLQVAHEYALTICKAIAHAASPKSGRNVKIWLMPL